MGEIYDFNTGDIIKIGKIPKRKNTTNLIESLYQRRHQIGDIIVICNDKVHGMAQFYMSCGSDQDRRILHTYFNDYMGMFFDKEE